MKTVALITLTFASAFAFARPDSRNLTCVEAANLVDQEEAVVMTYGTSRAGGDLYALFTSTQRCSIPGGRAVPAWVPTRDSASCFVGYVCRQGGHK